MHVDDSLRNINEDFVDFDGAMVRGLSPLKWMNG